MVPRSLSKLYFYLKGLVFSLAKSHGKESERFMCTLGRLDAIRGKRKHTRMNHVTDREKQRSIVDGAITAGQTDLLPHRLTERLKHLFKATK